MSGTGMDDAADTRPTVVLVHGAFADASSWNAVIERLQARGVRVTAPANPLRGITSDSAYLAAVLAETSGPVIAVGHSYGGALITNAATVATNVAGLVYIAAFATDEGEILGAVKSKDAILGSALVPHRIPAVDGAAPVVEFTVDPARFREAFAADLPVEQAAVLAAAQRPAAEAAFSEPGGVPAWKKLPSWVMVAKGDKAAGADVVRSMAERAGATITEIEGSHLIMLSQPAAVTEVILAAVEAVRAGATRRVPVTA